MRTQRPFRSSSTEREERQRRGLPSTDAIGAVGSLPVPPRIRSRFILSVSVLVLLTMAVWWPCLSFRFVYDDHSQIENNPRVQSATYAGQLLTQPLWAQLGANRASHYYRPVLSLLFLSEYLLFGPHPGPWHAINLLLHVAVVLSAFLLLLLLFQDLPAAFAGSVVFAVLPINAEVVSWLGAADDSLYSALLILSLCSLIAMDRVSSSRRRVGLMVASGLLFAVALFTKETAIGAGLILLSYQLIVYQPASERRRARMLRTAGLIYFIPLGLYFSAREYALHSSTPPLQRQGMSMVLSAVPQLAWLSVRQLTWPQSISPFYDIPLQTNTLSMVAAALLAVGMVLVAVLVVNRAPLPVWALTVLVFPALPWIFAVLYLSPYALFQNRYLYLSSLAIPVMLVYGLSRIPASSRMRPVTMAMVFLASSVLALAARTASLAYYDDLALFRRAVETAPNNLLAVGLLADAEEHDGDPGRARDLYERAVAMRPDLWKTHFSLAMLDRKQGAQADAAESLKKSIAVADASEAERALSWYEVGILELEKNDLAGAEAAFREAAARQPSSKRVQTQLIHVLEMEGRGDDARTERLRGADAHVDEQAAQYSALQQDEEPSGRARRR